MVLSEGEQRTEEVPTSKQIQTPALKKYLEVIRFKGQKRTLKNTLTTNLLNKERHQYNIPYKLSQNNRITEW